MPRTRLLFVFLVLFATAATVESRAPNSFLVRFVTTIQTGPNTFYVEVFRDYAPRSADRFFDLVLPYTRYYSGNAFYHVEPNFVQWGINGDIDAQRFYDETFPDEPRILDNTAGTICFIGEPGVPNSRSTKVFVNMERNQNFDELGYVPFGVVVEGMEVLEKVFAGYGSRPNENTLKTLGNDYLLEEFPELDYILGVSIVSRASGLVFGGGGSSSDSDSDSSVNVTGIIAPAVILGVILLLLCCFMLMALLFVILTSGKDSGKFNENVTSKKTEHVDAEYGSTTQHSMGGDTTIEFPDTH